MHRIKQRYTYTHVSHMQFMLEGIVSLTCCSNIVIEIVAWRNEIA